MNAQRRGMSTTDMPRRPFADVAGDGSPMTKGAVRDVKGWALLGGLHEASPANYRCTTLCAVVLAGVQYPYTVRLRTSSQAESSAPSASATGNASQRPKPPSSFGKVVHHLRGAVSACFVVVRYRTICAQAIDIHRIATRVSSRITCHASVNGLE